MSFIKTKLCVLGAALSLLLSETAFAETDPNPDLALRPATLIFNPWKTHVPPTKRQGVPGIERTAKGRLWALYGRDVESTRTFQVLKKSDDDGQTWSDVKLMILPRRLLQEAQQKELATGVASSISGGGWAPETSS